MYNAIQTLAKRLFSDMKMKYLQMMNIDVHKTLQGFQAAHVAKRTRTLQRPLIEDCNKLNLLKLSIYSVP